MSALIPDERKEILASLIFWQNKNKKTRDQCCHIKGDYRSVVANYPFLIKKTESLILFEDSTLIKVNKKDTELGTLTRLHYFRPKLFTTNQNLALA